MEEEKKAIAPISTEQNVILQGDPEKQLEYAMKASQALIAVLQQKPKKVVINGEQYLEFEDWQTLGRFYGASVGIDWTKPIEKEGFIDKTFGYEARAVVYLKGEIVSSAEAMCVRTEKNWTNRDDFALRSMAQTRASAKALRNFLAWVAVLGGFKPTPVEEMPAEEISYVPTKESFAPTRLNGTIQHPTAKPEAEAWCSACGNPITEAVRRYSSNKFGRALCMPCQAVEKSQ
jgi:hypothetical protein